MAHLLISRIGGAPHEEWQFDGQRLTLACPSRTAVWFDGLVLQECEYLGGRAWSFDGSTLSLVGQAETLWTSSDGLLTPHGVGPESAWSFDSRSIVRLASMQSDSWKSSDVVPLPVLAYAAGLLK